jgi:hypothetical protein
MASRAGLLIGVLALQSASVSSPPNEPPMDKQLWHEQKCFAHELQQWRHLVLRQLSGTVVATDGMTHTDPLPDARVLARAWPKGRQFETKSDGKGRFSLPEATEGMYELAICQDGFNPWRGTVRVSQAAKENEGAFPVVLGW